MGHRLYYRTHYNDDEDDDETSNGFCLSSCDERFAGACTCTTWKIQHSNEKELHILISYDTHICASQYDDIHLQNGPAHILNHIHQTKGIIEPKTTSQANASGKKRTKTQTI